LSFCLQILGSGSAVAQYGRNHTSHALIINSKVFLIDCGEGTQIQLSKFRVKKERIAAIFISHLHGDHYLGLMGLLSSMHLLGRTKTLLLVSPPGLSDIITIQLKYSNTVLNYKIDHVEVSGDNKQIVFEDKYITVRTFPLNHRIPTVGFRFDEKPKQRRINKEKLPNDIKLQDIAKLKTGQNITDHSGNVIYNNELTLPPRKSRSYAFCSDTKYDPSLIDFIQNVNLLYHEATFLEVHQPIAEKTFHSTAKQAASIANQGLVGELIIGHFSARYKDISMFSDEAKSVFNKTFLAKEGDIYCIDD